MLQLFFAILSSFMIAMVLKYSETRKLNRYAVTSMNYITAFTISILLSINSESISYEINNDLYWAFCIGLFGGVLYFLGFIFIQKSIQENGVGITGAVSKLGIILPVVLSMILWSEIPNTAQLIGIMISFIAIVMVNVSSKDLSKMNKTIILLFLIAGFAEFSNKLFEKFGNNGYKSIFLFVVFFTAFWISLFYTVRDYKNGNRITKTEVMTGLFVGIPNMFASYFLIESFKFYKASVAFPIYSSGSILLINIGGIVIFKERLKAKEIFAIVLIIIAIVLMNLK